jgi:hypothetical protein
MEIEFNTRKKLQAFLRQISQLLLSDFPYPSSESALELIKGYFEQALTRLDRASLASNRNVLVQTCITSNERIRQHLPILGFLLRSTNIRNCFEAYHSFAGMASALIGPNAEVIMSSEWDFSPLTYPMNVRVLPNHVLIGMPSCESPNALVLPLAGHELGHSVWRVENLENKWVAAVRQKAIAEMKSRWPTFIQAFPEHSNLKPTDAELAGNMFLINIQSEIGNLSLCQIEELFCDATGIHLFGESYAYAFHYLLAPSLGGLRSITYPPLDLRAQLIAALGKLDLKSLGFADYGAEFRDAQPGLSSRDQFICAVADDITKSMGKEMYDEAEAIVLGKASQYVPNRASQAEIIRMFERGIPAREPMSISDILNAGWAYVRSNANTFNENERELIEWVSELALKSIEVLEYRSRAKNA